MTAHSTNKFKNIDVGATVLVEVPKVDRGPLDSKNVVGKVIEKRNELYKVGTSFGVINDWLPRKSKRCPSNPRSKLLSLLLGS